MISSTQIRSLTSEGISYEDEHGVEQFINFSQCYQNYLERELTDERWEQIKQLNRKTDNDKEAYIASVKEWKQVAIRNVLEPPWADGPFIEFHTKPPVRFKFASIDQFYEVRNVIENNGWVTFDLS